MPRESAQFNLLWLTVALVGFLALPVSARVIVPGVDSSQLDPSSKGRILLEELNCAACHEAEALRNSSRPSPRLGSVGGRLNPNYLLAFIQSPHQIKPSSLMPDLLADRPADEKRDIAEAMTHYLVSLNPGSAFQLQAPDAVAAEQGEKLFHSVGCAACHSPRDPSGEELLPEVSVPLGALERKYSHRSLTDFLRRPHAVRPGGRMPDLGLPPEDVERIAHYLLRKTRVPGHLAFTMWRGKVYEGLQGDVEKVRAGHVDDFALEKFANLPHHTAIQYEGYLRVDQAGLYKFHLLMNGGSLLINGSEVVTEAPSDRRGTKSIQASAELASGWHQIEFTYFHTGRDPRLVMEMEGPGLVRQAIPSSRLAISDQPIPVVNAWQVDPSRAAQGLAHVQQLGCAQCHDDLNVPRQRFTPLEQLDPSKGCLADGAGTPRYELDARQRELVALALPTIGQDLLRDEQQVNKTLAAFNCIACHEREGLGGVSPDRDAYFTGTHAALGDQGRLPPPLTHVGAKLTQAWLREVLLHGGRQRAYLHTRMPLFGEAQVGHLVDLFANVDTLEEAPIPNVTDLDRMKNVGHEMVGTEGFSCIACHDFNGQKSETIGALDLVYVTQRLQKNWFHLYLRNPARFHPSVIMPSYWPGGVSVRPGLLGGDAGLQIEALWSYLSDGHRAKNPMGLSRQSLYLHVADETVMCRGRGTAGYRGIGVGYPERINLAFDSEEMALRQLWKGEFANIDNGRFSARGRDRIQFPAGVPFHRLASMDDVWPYKGKTNYLFPQSHGYQYRGYFLDPQKRPTFVYRYGDIRVEDFFEDTVDSGGEPYFRRTLTFAVSAAQPTFFFRAATGREINPSAGGWRIGQLNLRWTGAGAGTAQVREGEPQELLIPLTLPSGTNGLVLEYRW